MTRLTDEQIAAVLQGMLERHGGGMDPGDECEDCDAAREVIAALRSPGRADPATPAAPPAPTLRANYRCPKCGVEGVGHCVCGVTFMLTGADDATTGEGVASSPRVPGDADEDRPTTKGRT